VATLRLFANLRETAGASSVELDGTTVGEVLDTATARYGDSFAAGLETAQVWVNGNQADRSTGVDTGDEIAVIPPVSGGATATQTRPDVVGTLLAPALGATVAIANVLSLPWLAAAGVAVVMVWLWDLSEIAESRRRGFMVVPCVVAAALASNGAYRWGRPGLAGAIAAGVFVVLVWAVLDQRHRSVDGVATSLVVALVGALASGTLVLMRMESVVDVAILATGLAGAVALTFATQKLGSAGLDPNVATLVGAVTAAGVAGWLAQTVEVGDAVLAGALAGGGIIAGRALGSLIRAGEVVHTTRAPGVLTALDGASLGVAMFWLGTLIFG
jgi:MoaD family protein